MKLAYLTLRTPSALPSHEGALPSQLTVLKWGDNHTAKGLVRVTERSLTALPAYHRQMNWDELALDFEHNSLPSSDTYRGEPVNLAAYLKVVPLKAGEPVRLDVTRWLPAGEGHARNYRDVSAVACVDKETNELVGIHSVALCRMGATPDMVFLSAPWEADRAPRTAEAALQVLREALNLEATSTPADVLAAFSESLSAMSNPTDKPTPDEAAKAAAAAAEAAAKQAAAEAAKPATPEAKPEAEADLKALSAAVASLAVEVKALRAEAGVHERAAIIAEAARSGKQLPGDDVLKLLDNVQLKALAASLPVTVPLEHRSPSVEQMALAAPGATQVADSISKITGVTDEMRKKYGSPSA